MHKKSILVLTTTALLAAGAYFAFRYQADFYKGKGYQTTEPVNRVEIVKARFADLPVVQALPFYLALDKGYFKEAGIEVELTQFEAPNQIVDALLSGKADFTTPSGAMGILGIAESKNPGKLKIYMADGGDTETPNDSLLVKNDSSVSSFTDLKGKKLGILPGIQWRTIAKYLLARSGLDSEKDVVLVELSPGLQTTALGSGEIDALLAIEPMATIVKEKNIGKEVVFAPTTAIANPFYPGAGAVSVEFANKYPEATIKVMSILARAVTEIRERPEEARQYLKGHTPLEDDLVAQAPVLRFRMFNELTDEEIKSVQKFYDIFYQYGVVESPIDFKSILFSVDK